MELRAGSRSGGQPLRILVADDHEVVRLGVRGLLEAEPGWVVCGEAATGREAVTETERLSPDVVVLDISMPDLNGIEAVRQIVHLAPRTHVLILTMHESEGLIGKALAAGARGYLLKSDAGRDLVTAIRALATNRTFFTSAVSAMLLEGYLRGYEESQAIKVIGNRLTAREREVVQLLAEGGSNKNVAGALGISLKTAETHRTNVLRKLGLHSIAELVRYAIRNEIIEA